APVLPWAKRTSGKGPAAGSAGAFGRGAGLGLAGPTAGYSIVVTSVRLGLPGAPPCDAVGRLVSTSVRTSMPTAKGPAGGRPVGATVDVVLALGDRKSTR